MTVRDARGRFAPVLTLARDVEDTGVRAVLAKAFPHWDLTDNPPLFDEALATVEETRP